MQGRTPARSFSRLLRPRPAIWILTLLLSRGAAWGATAEFAISRESGTERNAAVGMAIVPATGIPPDLARVQIVGPAGPVGSRILWARPGDPLSVLFDASSGATAFALRVTESAVPDAASEWAPRAGLVLETRARPEGPAESLAQIHTLWQRATNTFGRSLAPQIHDAVHRHGRTQDFLSHYSGWFQAPRDGSYAFATVSCDSSFALIDGRLVASWPGWHGIEGGRHGQHGGRVELKRGPHQVEYWHALRGADFIASLAWMPPGATEFAVMPAGAFAPVALFQAAANGPSAAFTWEIARHAMAGDAMLATVNLQAIGASEGRAFEWSFDDGTAIRGPRGAHVFSYGGPRRVTLTVKAPGSEPLRVIAAIAVHPVWTQLAECPDPVYEHLCQQALRLPLEQLSPAALAGFVRMAERMDDAPFLDGLQEALFARREAFTGVHAFVLHRLGFHYQRPGRPRYDRVPVVWRAVLDDATAAADLRARTAVHLAGFLVHSLADPAEGLRLLNETSADERLSTEDRRLKTIFRGDALVLLGQREAALAAYRQAGTTVGPEDTDYEVRRRVRIETARDDIRRKEYEAAERLLRGLEWERPVERLELETGLMMVEVFRGRGENVMALGICRRLLAAAPADPRRPELLLAAAATCRDLKRETECRELVAQLLKDHPYSEAAALAKDRLGGGR